MKMLVFPRLHNYGQFVDFLYLVEIYYWVLGIFLLGLEIYFVFFIREVLCDIECLSS